MSTNTNDPFLIDSLRVFKGLSLRELAKIAGLNASGLSFWIRGKEKKGFDGAAKIGKNGPGSF